jgi:hypothetical protein
MFWFVIIAIYIIGWSWLLWVLWYAADDGSVFTMAAVALLWPVIIPWLLLGALRDALRGF